MRKSVLIGGFLLTIACSPVSLDDEARAWVDECEAMRKKLKDVESPMVAKTIYEEHEDALKKKRKAVKDATKWVGMSSETNKAYNECRSETHSKLEGLDKRLAQQYKDDVLDK